MRGPSVRPQELLPRNSIGAMLLDFRNSLRSLDFGDASLLVGRPSGVELEDQLLRHLTSDDACAIDKELEAIAPNLYAHLTAPRDASAPAAAAAETAAAGWIPRMVLVRQALHILSPQAKAQLARRNHRPSCKARRPIGRLVLCLICCRQIFISFKSPRSSGALHRAVCEPSSVASTAAYVRDGCGTAAASG